MLLSFCNNTVFSFITQLGTKSSFKHCWSFQPILLCKLLKAFNQNSWNKSSPGDAQSGILPVAFLKLSLVISIFSYFLTAIAFCKSFNHLVFFICPTDWSQKLFQFFSTRFLNFTSCSSFLTQASIKLIRLFCEIMFSLNLSILSWYLQTFAVIEATLCFNSSITNFNVFIILLYSLSYLSHCFVFLAFIIFPCF